MRKRLKKKLRSCALCKPHKMGWDNRWKPKDAALLEEAEKEIIEASSFSLQSTAFSSVYAVISAARETSEK